jgi:hypothetical protein
MIKKALWVSRFVDDGVVNVYDQDVLEILVYGDWPSSPVLVTGTSG